MVTKMKKTFQIKAKIPWWRGAYMNTCEFFAKAFGLEVDYDKATKLLLRNSKFERVDKD